MPKSSQTFLRSYTYYDGHIFRQADGQKGIFQFAALFYGSTDDSTVHTHKFGPIEYFNKAIHFGSTYIYIFTEKSKTACRNDTHTHASINIYIRILILAHHPHWHISIIVNCPLVISSTGGGFRDEHMELISFVKQREILNFSISTILLIHKRPAELWLPGI